MFFQGKKVLVAGGAGLVGTHLIQQLLEQGAKVRVTIHNRPIAAYLKNVETITADLTSLEDCQSAMQGIDYVFQAAGSVGSAGTTPAETMADLGRNLIIAERMLHAAWLEDVERLLLLSSSTVYPAFDHPVKEDEAWDGPTHDSYFGYGWMKRYLEKLAEYVASKSDVKIALVRPTATYGPWDYSRHVVPMLISKAMERQDPFNVWGSGEEVRDFLHVKDLARGCLLMLEKHAVCDPVNLGYGSSFTIKDVVGFILKATDYTEAKIEFDASRPTAIPYRMVDTSKAKELLGFEPEVSLEDGILDAVKWRYQLES